MRIFVYEFVTGGGWHHIDSRESPEGSLLAEGRAMLEAAATDFAALPDCEVVTFRDQRLAPLRLPRAVKVRTISSGRHEQAQFEAAAREADAVLIIAPEFAKYLWDRAGCVEHVGGRWLALSRRFVEVASDKWATHQALVKQGVPRPASRMMTQGKQWPTDLAGSLVAKPVDGCGSINVQRLQSPSQFDWTNFPGRSVLLEKYCPGLAASVALLCGPRGIHSLPACTQLLSGDGDFAYLGGECPLPEPLNFRAQTLARRAMEAMPAATGCVGVDLVLDDAADGSQDYVIEINPRLTTSYVGLRVLSHTNLAQAMLDVAQGRQPQLDWKPGRVRWSADGVVDYFEP